MKRAAAIALIAVAVAGCQTIGGYYDRIFGSSTPAQKPTELQPITASAEARMEWQADVGVRRADPGVQRPESS